MHKYNQIVTECFVYFSHKPPKHACKAIRLFTIIL